MSMSTMSIRKLVRDRKRRAPAVPSRVQARPAHVTVRRAAELIGVHENTLRKWTARGIIAAVHLPGSNIRRIPESEIERVRAEMWRGVPLSDDPGVARSDVPRGTVDDDGFDFELP
jgi:excisionase family DNA binding protein